MRSSDFRYSFLYLCLALNLIIYLQLLIFLRCLLGAMHQRRSEGVSSSPESLGILLHACTHTLTRTHQGLPRLFDNPLWYLAHVNVEPVGDSMLGLGAEMVGC